MSQTIINNTGEQQKFLEKWSHLLKEGIELDFKPGQYLFYQGHLPCGVFLLLSGEVRLQKTKSDGTVQCSALPVNWALGLDFCLAGQAYPFDALAVGPAKLYFVPKELIKSYLNNPKL